MSGGVDFWIDAVCINQADTSERNHQVRLMRDIYSQAEEVIAWLGPSNSESDFLLDFLNNASVNLEIFSKFASYDEYLKTLFSEHDTRDKLDKLSVAFADLDARDYWCRIWIVQEIHLASRVVFWVGHRHINGLLLRLSLHDIEQYSTRFRSGTMQSIVTAIGTNEYTNLEDCIRKFGNLECQDSLDKVYALLGMVKQETHDVATLEVKYENSTEELFARTMTYCMPKCPMDFALHLGSLLGVNVYSRNKGRWWLPVRGRQRSLTSGHAVGMCLHSSGFLAELDFVSNTLPTSPVQYITPHAQTGQNRGHESRCDPKPTSPTSVFMHKDASRGDLVFSIDAPRVVTLTRTFFPQPFKHGISVSAELSGPLKLSSVHLGCILDLSVQDWVKDVEILQILLEQLGLLEAFCRASRLSIEIRAGRRILQVSTQTDALMNYAFSLETSAKAYHARRRTRPGAET